MRPANVRARRPVGLRRHAARIHNDHICRGRLLLAVPRRAQAIADRLAIGARRPASKVLHMECGRHLPSLRLSRFHAHLYEVV